MTVTHDVGDRAAAQRSARTLLQRISVCMLLVMLLTPLSLLGDAWALLIVPALVAAAGALHAALRLRALGR